MLKTVGISIGRAWFDLEAAAAKVSDPELSLIVGTLQQTNGDDDRSARKT